MEKEGSPKNDIGMCKYEKDSNKEVSKISSPIDLRENEELGGGQKKDANRNENERMSNSISNELEGCDKLSSEGSESNDCETGGNKNTSLQRKRKNVLDEISPEGEWVIRTFTGYIVTLVVPPDKDRPDNFQTERAEMMWNVATEINLNRLKHQIQTGEYLPDNAKVDVDPNPLKPPTSRIADYFARLETEEQRQEKVSSRREQNIMALEKELEFVGLMINIRECFSGKHQFEEGLTLLEEVSKLQITPLMLTKNPFTMNTIYCLCHYAGMPSQLDTDNDPRINEVKSKAKDLYNKVQSLFKVPDNLSFEKFFKNKVKLTWKMLRSDVDAVYELVNDPTTMFF